MIIKTGKHISAFFGSPRKNGYSSSLHEAAISTACGTVRRFYLYDMNIRPCTGCGYCREKSKCSIHDDMSLVIESVLSSDVLSFSFPLYFSSIPGSMKTMIDRFQVLWEASRRGEYSVKGQRSLAFVTAGSEYGEMFTPSKTILRHLMRSLEGEFCADESIYCPGMDTDEGIASYRKILEALNTGIEKN